MTDLDAKLIEKIQRDLDNAMAQVCAKNEGAPGGALLCALAAVVAQAINLYAPEKTPASRAKLLTYFISAVKDNLEQNQTPQ